MRWTLFGVLLLVLLLASLCWAGGYITELDLFGISAVALILTGAFSFAFGGRRDV
jgi:hypothetical protein